MTNKTDKNSNETRSEAEAQSKIEQLSTDTNTGKFPLGQIVATTHATEELSPWDILDGIIRHHSGDWGDVCEEDRRENESSLVEGFRLMSVYKSGKGITFWIITEWDRSITTVLLPEDY